MVRALEGRAIARLSFGPDGGKRFRVECRESRQLAIIRMSCGSGVECENIHITDDDFCTWWRIDTERPLTERYAAETIEGHFLRRGTHDSPLSIDDTRLIKVLAILIPNTMIPGRRLDRSSVKPCQPLWGSRVRHPTCPGPRLAKEDHTELEW